MLAWILAEDAEMAEHAAGADAAGGQAEQALPELPNLIGEVHHILEGLPATAPAVESFNATVAGWGFNDPMGTPVTAFETVAFAFLYIALLSAFFISSYKRMKKSPKEGTLSRRALFMEIVVLFFEDLFGSVFPDKQERRKHLSLIGTLFIYILVCNTGGLIFLGRAPTANLSFNLGLALLVFAYVHFTGISRSPLGYLKHFPGTLPTMKELGPVMGVIMIPFLSVLFVFIHIAELIIQPISLSLRLFGNIMGKDVLLGAFATLVTIQIAGIKLLSIPFHIPFLFLGLLLGSIQALIFSLLSAMYISMWLPHDHSHEHELHGEGHAH